MATRSRVRLAADTRRAQIVDEATSLIARDGYHRFSIAALAEQCQLTRAGVLHHVGSKEQLLVDVIRERDAQVGAATALASETTDAVDVRELLDGVVRQNIAQPELARLYTVLLAESLSAEHPAHEIFKQRFHDSVQTLAPLLTGFTRGGSAVAVEILSIIDGLQAHWLRDPSMDLWRYWTDYADNLFTQRSARVSK